MYTRKQILEWVEKELSVLRGGGSVFRPPVYNKGAEKALAAVRQKLVYRKGSTKC